MELTMPEIWMMTGQIAALAFVLSMGVAGLIYVIRVALRRFVRDKSDS